MDANALNLIATCAFGLEAPVKWELADLGYDSKSISPGKIGFSGDWIDICRTNLWLRSADRVQIQAATFSAPDFDALYETTKAMDWSRWMTRDAAFPVSGRSRNSKLTSVPAVQRSVKRAIVESLRREYKTEILAETGPEYRIEVALLDDQATLTIDTTGASLHKRGYRPIVGNAPIKETLAAAMIALSVWNPNRPLVDPFCGSGTIPIEAALIGMKIAPGLQRQFISESWPQIQSSLWQQARTQARDLIRRDQPMQISGTDIDSQVLELARLHAVSAGVADQIHFQQKGFEQLRSKRQYGCIVTNPPYGQRLQDERELMPLYQSMPAVFQRLPTWSFFIITSMPHFESMVQTTATRRRKLYNGRIECTYFQFLGPRPPRKDSAVRNFQDDEIHAADDLANAQFDLATEETQRDTNNKSSPKPVPASVFGGIDDKDQQQADLFATRLKKRGRHFRRWPTKRGVTCFRLYERDIPELPFVVDRYEDFFHITEFERPHDRSIGHHAAWLELMKKTVAKTFEAPIQKVILKSRSRQIGLTQHEKVTSEQRRIVAHEGGLKFLVNMTDYIDTGLFLDHRTTRQMVRDEARDKRFLNLFGYTGSFSVYAAAGGARSTCTVDWSNTYLNWARDNMQLNNFTGVEHQFVNRDAVSFVHELFDDPMQHGKFDLVVVDPPTFSNSKRTDDIWDVQKHHAQLLNLLFLPLSAGGTIFFATNFRKFKLASSELTQYKIVEISNQTVPEDFRNRRIHRCWKLIKP